MEGPQREGKLLNEKWQGKEAQGLFHADQFFNIIRRIGFITDDTHQDVLDILWNKEWKHPIIGSSK